MISGGEGTLMINSENAFKSQGNIGKESFSNFLDGVDR